MVFTAAILSEHKRKIKAFVLSQFFREHSFFFTSQHLQFPARGKKETLRA
jgi:hypothetical protein